MIIHLKFYIITITEIKIELIHSLFKEPYLFSRMINLNKENRNTVKVFCLNILNYKL